MNRNPCVSPNRKSHQPQEPQEPQEPQPKSHPRAAKPQEPRATRATRATDGKDHKATRTRRQRPQGHQGSQAPQEDMSHKSGRAKSTRGKKVLNDRRWRFGPVPPAPEDMPSEQEEELPPPIPVLAGGRKYSRRRGRWWRPTAATMLASPQKPPRQKQPGKKITRLCAMPSAGRSGAKPLVRAGLSLAVGLGLLALAGRGPITSVLRCMRAFRWRDWCWMPHAGR